MLFRSYPCGYSCISRNRNCRKPLSGQARTAAEWVAQQESVKQSKGYKGLIQKAEQRFEKELKAMDDAIAESGRRLKSIAAERTEAIKAIMDVEADLYSLSNDPNADTRIYLGKKAELIELKQRFTQLQKMAKDNEQSLVFDACEQLKRSILSTADSQESQRLTDRTRIRPPAKLRPYGVDMYRQELISLHAITGNKVTTLEEVTYKKQRAYAVNRSDPLPGSPKSGNPGMINVGRAPSKESQITVFWHEFGHHLEYSNPEYKQAATEWRNARATSDKPVKLSALDPFAGYKDDEVALPGRFIHPYVGKVYARGSTEVISMGLERFSRPSDMADFYRKDREHFLLILGMLG